MQCRNGCAAIHAMMKVDPGGFAFKPYTLTSQDESMRIVGFRGFLCC